MWFIDWKNQLSHNRKIVILKKYDLIKWQIYDELLANFLLKFDVSNSVGKIELKIGFALKITIKMKGKANYLKLLFQNTCSLIFISV